MSGAKLDLKDCSTDPVIPARVGVDTGREVLPPVNDMVLSLEQRLARFDPVRHGGEAMRGSRWLESGGMEVIDRQGVSP